MFTQYNCNKPSASRIMREAKQSTDELQCLNRTVPTATFSLIVVVIIYLFIQCRSFNTKLLANTMTTVHKDVES